jgi:predicted nucleotide-binding protein
MARKPSEPRRATLTPQAMRTALPKIKRRMEELQALDPTQMRQRDDPSFSAAEDRANQTLSDVFGPDTVEFRRFRVHLDTAGYAAYEVPPEEWIPGYQHGIADAVEKLKSVVQLFEENLADGLATDAPQTVQPTPSRKVFLVHGHDEGAKQEVARFLERLRLEAIVLHEQPNRGQTIIEKFERHSAEAAFAIVLLTPDDVGYATGKAEAAKSRARQNVVFELGVFISKLTRKNVVALMKGDIEIPSDLHGVIYEPMDDRGAWKLNVAREMKVAGLEVDMNLAM